MLTYTPPTADVIAESKSIEGHMESRVDADFEFGDNVDLTGYKGKHANLIRLDQETTKMKNDCEKKEDELGAATRDMRELNMKYRPALVARYGKQSDQFKSSDSLWDSSDSSDDDDSDSGQTGQPPLPTV